MTTAVKTPKYRRKTEQEMGRSITPTFEAKDREVIGRIKGDFPRYAEKGARASKGKTRYTGIDINETKRTGRRKDTFVLKYGDVCPYPKSNSKKDNRGEWYERCRFKMPRLVKNETGELVVDGVPDKYKEMYEDANYREKYKGTCYENVSLIQFCVMKHCEEEHFDWWMEENGSVTEYGGKKYIRPPMNMIVNAPEWAEA